MAMKGKAKGGGPAMEGGSQAGALGKAAAKLASERDAALAALQAMWPEGRGMPVRRPHVMCADGTSWSAQASEWTYCRPRDNFGPWTHVEVGFPSQELREIMPWAEDPAAPTDTVYGGVPVALMAGILAARGGRVDRQSAWRCEPMGFGAVKLAPAAPVRSRPRVVDFDDARAAKSACAGWFQAAVLGSPAEERAARFAAASNGARMQWRDCLACLAMAAAGCPDGEGMEEAWAAAAVQRLAIEAAAGPGKAPKRSASL